MERKKITSVTIDPDILAAGQEAARDEGISFSQMVERLVVASKAQNILSLKDRLDAETKRRGLDQPGSPFSDVLDLIGFLAGQKGGISRVAIDEWLPRLERAKLPDDTSD